MFENWFSRKTEKASSYNPNASYSILIDANTLILYAVHASLAAIVSTSESIPDTTFQVTHSNAGTPFSLAAIRPTEYPRWTWEYRTRNFTKTPEHALIDEVRAKSRLAVARVNAFNEIMKGINYTRYQFRRGVEFQESVYLAKRLEAKDFMERESGENVAHEYPYLMQYADFADIPLRQAAEDILFKARLEDTYLVKTEYLRIKYFNATKNETDPAKIPAIIKEFNRECYTSNLT